MKIRYRKRDYEIALRPELAINGASPWCINVDGNWYELTSNAAAAVDEARQYARYSLTNVSLRTPSFFASRRYPLLLVVDGVAVRAWPQWIPRGRGAKTFVHPTLGRRVATVKDTPFWMFECTGRAASECGSMSAEQTVDDVADLAKLWLREPAVP